MAVKFYDLTAPASDDAQRLDAIEETLEDIYAMVLGFAILARPAPRENVPARRA